MATIVTEAVRPGWYSAADRVLWLLESLAHLRYGLPVDQLTHALQTATHAEDAGASDELVLAALCHDMGKALTPHNHAAVAAEILRPYVSAEAYAVVRFHDEFRYADLPAWTGVDPGARNRHRDEPWYATAVVFADEWDAGALDPAGRPRPLGHFVPLLRDRLEDR